MSIPDINHVRQRSNERKAIEELGHLERLRKFTKAKQSAINHFYTDLEEHINFSLLQGLPAYVDFSYRECYDHLHDDLYFPPEDHECFEVMDDVSSKIEFNYSTSHYKVSIDKLISCCGNHFADSYSIQVNF